MEMLDLNDAYVTDDIMPGLAGMKKLRRLTMVGTLITDEGLQYLQDLTALEELDLYGVHITDKGVQYLRKLTRLRRLNLLGAQLTDASAAVLAGASGVARSQCVPQPAHQRRLGEIADSGESANP